MSRSTLQLPAVVDKDSLLQAFAGHCGFAEHFGYNWDALWDSLGDWLETQDMPLYLEVDGSRIRQLNAPDWQICQEILDDACAEWPEFTYHLTGWPDPVNPSQADPEGKSSGQPG